MARNTINLHNSAAISLFAMVGAVKASMNGDVFSGDFSEETKDKIRAKIETMLEKAVLSDDQANNLADVFEIELRDNENVDPFTDSELEQLTDFVLCMAGEETLPDHHTMEAFHDLILEAKDEAGY